MIQATKGTSLVFLSVVAVLFSGHAQGMFIGAGGARETPLLTKGHGLLLYKGLDNSPYAGMQQREGEKPMLYGSRSDI